MQGKVCVDLDLDRQMFPLQRPHRSIPMCVRPSRSWVHRRVGSGSRQRSGRMCPWTTSRRSSTHWSATGATSARGLGIEGWNGAETAPMLVDGGSL